MKKSGAVVAVAATAPALLAAAGKKRPLPKAVMYGTIGLNGTVLEKFKALKAAGFDGVEPESHMNQEEVVAALKESGLKAASVCCKTHWNKPLSDPKPEVRAEGLEGFKQALRDAKAYGAGAVLLVPGVAKNGVSYEECFQRSIVEIRKALPLAEEYNVQVGMENVGNNFVSTPQQAIEYLDAIKHPLVGWYFDIGNMLRLSPPEDWIRVLGKRLVRIHFKEASKSKGQGMKFFEGDNNWPTIMKAIDEVGYASWATTEQSGKQTSDAEALKDFSERLDRILAS